MKSSCYASAARFALIAAVAVAVSSMPLATSAADPRSPQLTRAGLVLGYGPSGTFDSDELGAPTILIDGGTYLMWYFGRSSGIARIGYATSLDGHTWTKQGAVLSPTLPEEVGGVVAYPEVLKLGTEFRMWYSGYDGTFFRILTARSPDGLSWVKDGVALDVGPAGAPDDRFVYDPTIVMRGGVFYMWYSGLSFATGRPSLLLAVSPDGITWTKQGPVSFRGPQVADQDGLSLLRSVL